MTLASYSREQVTVSVAGQPLEGFAAGDFCVVERAEDQTTLEVGTHGEVDAMQMSRPNGSIVLTVMGSSDANDILQELKSTWDEDGSSTFPILIKDVRSGAKVASCRDAIISKDPTQTFGESRGTTEWTILCPHLTMVNGGALRISF